MTDLILELKNGVIEGDAERATDFAHRALAAGIPAEQIFAEGIVAGIQETGVLWDCNRYRVPDVILAADAFNEAVAVIEAHLQDREATARAKVVLGVVEGDVHDLGKNIVAAMLRGAGLHVVDIGVDVAPEAFVEAVRRERPQILGIGAYMSTTMLAVPEIMQALEQAGLRAGVKVIVGGVPTSRQFAASIDADGWAPDALAAVQVVNALLEHSL